MAGFFKQKVKIDGMNNLKANLISTTKFTIAKDVREIMKNQIVPFIKKEAYKLVPIYTGALSEALMQAQPVTKYNEDKSKVVTRLDIRQVGGRKKYFGLAHSNPDKEGGEGRVRPLNNTEPEGSRSNTHGWRFNEKHKDKIERNFKRGRAAKAKKGRMLPYYRKRRPSESNFFLENALFKNRMQIVQMYRVAIGKAFKRRNKK